MLRGGEGQGWGKGREKRSEPCRWRGCFRLKKAVTHPIVCPESLWFGYVHSLGTPLVTVVTRANDSQRTGEQSLHVLIYIYVRISYIYIVRIWSTKKRMHAERYVGCLKAAGSVHNCSAAILAVISVLSLRGDVLSALTDRPWLTALPSSFLSLSPSLSLPPAVGQCLYLPLCVPQPYNEIHYWYR